MKQIDLTEEQKKELQTIQEIFTNVVYKSGQIEIALMDLYSEKTELAKELMLIRKKEDSFANGLQMEYGTGQLDIENLKFIKE